MSKGLMFGLLIQCISAVGYLVNTNVMFIKSELFWTGLMIVFASVVALIVMGYTVISGQQQLSAIQAVAHIKIAHGSIMVMFVAQAIFFVGVQPSNMATMALTLLAFPFISLILELVLGRTKLSSLGIYELVWFVLIANGYLVYISKPQAYWDIGM